MASPSSQVLRRRIEDLASDDPALVEAARDGLAALGAPAVPALVSLLDEDDDTLRLRAISLLSLLSDPRSAGALVALLHDPSARIRQRAAGALSRFAAPEAVRALARLLARETSIQVRQVATRSLVRHVRAGSAEALNPILVLLSDEDEAARVRLIALEAVPWIELTGSKHASCVSELLDRLASSRDAQVSARARRLIDDPPRVRLEPDEIDRLLEALGGRGHAAWRRAVSLLGAAGPSIVDPLVEAMLARPQDDEYARRAGLALKGLSTRSLARLARWIDEVTEPVVLETLVDVATQAGSRVLLARLGALIERIGSDEGAACVRVRCRAHLALARAGSRLAADDLRRLLDAATMVGTRRELPVLFRAYRGSRGVLRLAVRETVVAIARRERLRRTDRFIKALDDAERRAAQEILGAPRAARRRLRAPHVDTPPDRLLT